VLREDLTHLLRKPEFQVVSEKEAQVRAISLPAVPLVLIFNENVLTPPPRPFLRAQRARFPEARILILGTEPPRGQGCQLLLGIDGFVTYRERKKKLIPALRTLANGHLQLPPEVLEYNAQVAIQTFRHKDNAMAHLTHREAEVIVLVKEGHSNKQIGARLNIRERTVKFHMGNILAKFGAQDRYAAADLAYARPALQEAQLADAHSLPPSNLLALQ
jgi:DNA-binding NarL/FixJ family response regulator